MGLSVAERPGAVADDPCSITGGVPGIAQREPLDLEPAPKGFPQGTTNGEMTARITRPDRRLVKGFYGRRGALVVAPCPIVAFEMRQIAADDEKRILPPNSR